MAGLARYVIIGILSYTEEKENESIDFVVRDTHSDKKEYYVVECDMSDGDNWHNGSWRTYLRERDVSYVNRISDVPYYLQYIINKDDEPDFYSVQNRGDDYYPYDVVEIHCYAFRSIETLMEDIVECAEKGDTERMTNIVQNTQPEIFNIIRMRDETVFKLLPIEVQSISMV